jgi:hypothetical protein
MPQHDTTGGAAITPLTAPARDTTADLAQDPVSIFSASGLEAVFQWWSESKRRWTERNEYNATVHPAVVHREAR